MFGLARQLEVFAGFQENCDYEIGRVVAAVEELGLGENTLIIYIWGDNSSSMEGTETGAFNEMTTFNGLDVPAARQLSASCMNSKPTCPASKVRAAAGGCWSMANRRAKTSSKPPFPCGFRVIREWISAGTTATLLSEAMLQRPLCIFGDHQACGLRHRTCEVGECGATHGRVAMTGGGIAEATAVACVRNRN